MARSLPSRWLGDSVRAGQAAANNPPQRIHSLGHLDGQSVSPIAFAAARLAALASLLVSKHLGVTRDEKPPASEVTQASGRVSTTPHWCSNVVPLGPVLTGSNLHSA